MKRFILASLLMSATTIQANDIVLSAKIKSSYKSKIERDMNVLENLNFQEPIAQTLKVMDITSLNSLSVSRWLNDRVKYIIEEDALSLKKQIFSGVLKVEQVDVIYPNEDLISYNPLDLKNSKEEETTVSPNSDSKTVMTNTGSILYYVGKSKKILYGMRIPNGFLKKSTKVILDSPRSGVIQIGGGLFDDILTINLQNQNSYSNSINRLSTFFHEARHSDGNSDSLGFFHTLCPKGHSYSNQYACDENLNGSYTVGSLMTLEMLKACNDNCTENEKEVLRLVALDSKERVLLTTKSGTPSKEWDSTPESL